MPLATASDRRDQIGAGAETLAGRHQHARPQVAFGVDVAERVGQVAHQLDADVVVRRPVDLQQRDMPVAAQRYLAVAFLHRFVPSKIARHHPFMHFGRAVIDAHGAQLGHQLQRHFLGHAHGAEGLHGVVDHLLRHLGGEGLDHRDFEAHVAALVELSRRNRRSSAARRGFWSPRPPPTTGSPGARTAARRR